MALANMAWYGGQNSTRVSKLASGPSWPGFDSQHSQNVAEVNQRSYFEQSRQLLENVNQCYLVMASGKLVLQQTEVEKLKLALKVEIGLD